MKRIISISLLLCCLFLQVEGLYAQEGIALLEEGKALYNQGKIGESEEKLGAYFNNEGKDKCTSALLEYQDLWAITSLLNQRETAVERLSAVEKCAKELGLDSLWATYLIHHSEALRLMNMDDEARIKLSAILTYPDLEPNDRAQSYAILASCYVEEKGDSTILFANRSLEIALKINDTIAILESYNALAQHALRVGKLHEGIQWNRKSLNYEVGPYVRKKPETFNNLVVLFFELKDYQKAEKYIDSTFQSLDTSAYIQFSALMHKRAGDVYVQTNRFDRARDSYQRSLAKTKRDFVRFDCLLGLSELAKKTGNPAQSNKYLDQALELGESIDKSEIQQSMALLQSRKSIRNGQYAAAKSWALKGIALQENHSITRYNPDFYQQLAIATGKLNQPKQSLDYYKKYYHGKDSLTKLINQELVYTLENEYTMAAQDKELAGLQTQHVIQQLRLQQQRWMGIGVLLFFGVLAATIFFLFRLNKKIRSQTQTIRETVTEKNILLKEIHHRVKNNLQVISSLFNLQSRFVKDERALEALKESHNRVNSLALLHQNLYQEENLKGIEMPAYIDQLCDSLFTSSANSNQHINYLNTISPLTLDIDTVIPLGLIITELITSALKRNFSQDENAIINVDLEEKENTLALTVRDNSLAYETGSNGPKKSFSQKIIDAFSKKLKADLHYNTENGTEVQMVIHRYRRA